jgi:hypothetical protein
MSAYLEFLFAVVATVLTLLTVAGGAFVLVAMWVAMKDRFWPL